jgi:hypothetical protein
MKKIITSLFFSVITFFCFAQDQVEMADTLRSSGKIYVVVAVLVTILIGILLYLVLIDRKVSRIEKDIKQK